ncbi:TetR family transcriptional regulator [Neorhizobium sp. Rsf11]|uniref:TetR family transcriptional regulator n=1 Tax=Neorhizobium phenanthreniclasticum TaxID=3157917 RepID=A0ABV0MBI0_9HYPH
MRRPRRKAEETREDILNTAEILFRERGIAKCSIADVAQALSMSPANIFKHFHSKAALADAICDRHISRMIGRFGTLDEPAPAPERLAIVVRKLMEAHLQDIRENPFLFEMIFLMSEADLPSGQHYKELIESLFTDLIRQGVASGAYKCTNPHAISRHVAAAFASVLHPVLLAKSDEAELYDRCDGLTGLVNAALQNPLVK